MPRPLTPESRLQAPLAAARYAKNAASQTDVGSSAPAVAVRAAFGPGWRRMITVF